MLAGYLLIGVGVSAGLAILDSHTYPEHSLSPVFIVTNIVVWPLTLLSVLVALLELHDE